MRKVIILGGLLIGFALVTFNLLSQTERRVFEKSAHDSASAVGTANSEASLSNPKASVESRSEVQSSEVYASEPVPFGEFDGGEFEIFGVIRWRESGTSLTNVRVSVSYTDIVEYMVDPLSVKALSESELLRNFEQVSTEVDDGGRFSISIPSGAVLWKLRATSTEVDDRVVPRLPRNLNLGPFEDTTMSLAFEVLDEDREIEVLVDAGISLSGVVLDAETLAPVRGAMVGCRALGTTSRGAYTDETGAFVIRGFSPTALQSNSSREWFVTAEHEDYLVRSRSFLRSSDSIKSRRIELHLDRGIRVSGYVVNSAGVGLEHVSLRLLAGMRSQLEDLTLGELKLKAEYASTVDCFTYENGWFAFPPVEPAAQGVVIAGGLLGSSTERLRVDDLTRDVSGLRLQLNRTVTVRVRASYPNGSAVAGNDMSVAVEDDLFGWEFSNFSSEDYRVVHVPEDAAPEIRVSASSPGGESSERHYMGSAAASPASVSSGVIDLQVVLEPVHVEDVPPRPLGTHFYSSNLSSGVGHVVDLQFVDESSGKPLANRMVVLGGEVQSSVLLGDEGYFRLGLLPGIHNLSFVAEGYESRVLALEFPFTRHSKARIKLTRLK